MLRKYAHKILDLLMSLWVGLTISNICLAIYSHDIDSACIFLFLMLFTIFNRNCCQMSDKPASFAFKHPLELISPHHIFHRTAFIYVEKMRMRAMLADFFSAQGEELPEEFNNMPFWILYEHTKKVEEYIEKIAIAKISKEIKKIAEGQKESS